MSQTPEYDEEGKFIGYNFSNVTTTSNDRKFEIEKFAASQNLQNMQRDLQEAGVYTTNFEEDIRRLQELLDNSFASTGL